MADDRSQIAIRLPEDKARKLKSIAAAGGLTIQEILEGSVDSFISAHESGQAQGLADFMAGREAAQG